MAFSYTKFSEKQKIVVYTFIRRVTSWISILQKMYYGKIDSELFYLRRNDIIQEQNKNERDKKNLDESSTEING